MLLDEGYDASLIVVGTRGLSALGALVLGSVSGQVAARSVCPTVVVPPDIGPDDGSIVVGVDGSPASDAALRFALKEATRRSDTVTAVNAFHAQAIPMLTKPEAYATALEREHAEKMVAEAVDRALDATGCGLDVTIHTVAGHPADAILDAGQGAAMIVVGSRGRAGVCSLVLGSTSHAVLHQAHRPVVVVHG